MNQTGSAIGQESCMLLMDVQDLGEGRAVLRCAEPRFEREMEVPVKLDSRKSIEEAFQVLDDFIALGPESPVIIISFDHEHQLALDMYRRLKRSLPEQQAHFSIEYLIKKLDASDLLLMHGMSGDVPDDMEDEHHWDFLLKVFDICSYYRS